IGIPPEDVPRVFDRFYTGANGRRGKASTGMGLYLASEICRRLGHELRLESTLGQGTTVSVTLTPQGLHRSLAS
ncbi:MAG TPA: ATP-binding protein, partial [Trueperaceae bacterium]|nr:ATP-binding protein [Trueperaceae bacterium]